MKRNTLAFLLCWSCFIAFHHSLGAEFFASPKGNDANPGTSGKPFATFAKAKAAAREARAASPNQPVVVTFRAGVYRLDQTLQFGPEDSGASAQNPVTYRARAGEQVVISGGSEPITGWRRDPTRPGIWKTKLASADTAWRPQQLWVNGERAIRARTPNYWEFGVLQSVTEQTSTNDTGTLIHKFLANPKYLHRLDDLSPDAIHDAQVVVLHKWDTTREPLQTISAAEGTFTTAGKKMQGWNSMGRDSLFYIENVLAALDSPGEWFLARNGTLYYRPGPGELLDQAEVIAPRLERFIEIAGEPNDPSRWVHDITFEGLNFRHAELALPAAGLPPAQAAMNCDRTAIQIDAARSIRFTRCSVEHIGSTAFWFRHACRDCRIETTRMFDLGIGGVRIGEPQIVPEPVRTGAITVDNCIIQSGGRIAPHTVAVWIGHNADNAITHCDIGDFFYTAISVGWRWGYAESAAKRNKIEFNHLHHLGYRILSDMGGVYTLGPSEGTTVRNNVIHDVYSTRYGGWGLYPDEGSTRILFENNLVYDVRDGCVHQHYGKENVFRNNVLAFSEEGQIAITRAEPHLSFTFEHNLVYWDTGYLLGYSGWRGGAKVDLHDNLYWRAEGKPFDFGGKSFAQWQEQGNDRGSVVADPLFENAAARDFRVRPGSPALRIGFQPIDYTQAGVYGSTAWKELAGNRQYPDPYEVPATEPLALKDGFENPAAFGTLLSVASVSQENHKDLVTITDETAATGKHSLKVQDAADLKQAFNPYFYLDPHFTKGKGHMSYRIRLQSGARASCEWRSQGNPYRTGPSLQFHDNAVFARQQKLMDLPANTWLGIDIRSPLGEPNSRWDVTVTLPGGETKAFKDLPCDPEWKEARWVGFSSNATQPVAFYLDDLQLDDQ